MRVAIPPVPPVVPVIPPHPELPDSRWLADWENRDFLELGACDTAPRTVRGLVRERLPLWGLDYLRDAMELVATELVTNSVGATRESVWQGSAPPVRVWLLGSTTTGAGAAVLVWDGVPREPAPCEPGLTDESGRGLLLVDALSAKWDYYFPACPFWGKVTRAFIVNS
jgi:hypothetical protein